MAEEILKKEKIEKVVLTPQEVNRLFKLYLNRMPTPEESDRFDSILESEESLLRDHLKKMKDEGDMGLEKQRTDNEEHERTRPFTDQELRDIYSEYGLPIPNNFDEIKKTMPNDEDKLRAILDIQRDLMNKKMKVSGENDVSSMKMAAAMPAAPRQMFANPTPAALAGGGQGGAGDNVSGLTASKWNQDGNVFLIKFNSDPNGNLQGDSSTVWFYNTIDRKYRPFLSMNGLKNFFGDNWQKAVDSIQTIPTSELNNESWKGEFLPVRQGIQDDGNVPESERETFNKVISDSVNNVKEPTETKLPRYGKTQDDNATVSAYNKLDKLIATLRLSKVLSDDEINKMSNDVTWVADAVNALAYGGYTMDDIYKDLKAKTLSASGDMKYQNTIGFNRNTEKSVWKNTTEGQNVTNDTTLKPDYTIIDVPENFWNLPISSVPDSAFKSLSGTQPIDWTLPENKEKAAAIEADYYDLQMQTAEATTAQEKAIAKSNWDLWVENLRKTYNINLSNNVRQAWSQLQSIFSGATNRGISGSGLINEILDNYLRDVRRSNQIIREANLDSEEQQKLEYLRNSGSPEEIQAFINESAENAIKAQNWGLTPAGTIKNEFSIEALKSKYPTMTDEEITQLRGLIFDDNGNYRSNLYKNLYKNKYDIGQNKLDYQQTELLNQQLRDIEVATTNPLSSYQPENASTEPTEQEIEQNVQDQMKTEEQKVQEQVKIEEQKVQDQLLNNTKNLLQKNAQNLPTAEDTPSSVWTKTNTTKAYDAKGNLVYVQPDKYYAGVSLTKPVTATPTFTAPTGYVKISSPSEISKYKKGTAGWVYNGKDMYGIPKTPEELMPAKPAVQPTISPKPVVNNPVVLNQTVQNAASEAAKKLAGGSSSSSTSSVTPQYENYMAETKEGGRIFGTSKAEIEAEAKKNKVNITGFKGYKNNTWSSFNW
jgi:hypothetical protein